MAYYQPDRRWLDVDQQHLTVQHAKVALAQALQLERKARDLSQSEVARRMGSSQPRVATIEAGSPVVRIELMMRALLATGVSIREIGAVISRSGI